MYIVAQNKHLNRKEKGSAKLLWIIDCCHKYLNRYDFSGVLFFSKTYNSGMDLHTIKYSRTGEKVSGLKLYALTVKRNREK